MTAFLVASLPVPDVVVYDPVRDTWNTGPHDMPTPRGGMYAVATGHVGAYDDPPEYLPKLFL